MPDSLPIPRRPRWPVAPAPPAQAKPPRTNLFALTVLALLSEEPKHPYEIQRNIRERWKEFADGKPRSLYHAVDRLAATGLIEPVETAREGRRPERTVYRITEEGREEFQLWLHELLDRPLAEHPIFTAAVSFLGYLPQDVVLDALLTRTVALEAAVAGFDATLRALQVEMRLPRLVVLEHECMRALKQAELEWVRAIVDDIRSGRLSWDRESLARHFDQEAATLAAPAPAASHYLPDKE